MKHLLVTLAVTLSALLTAAQTHPEADLNGNRALPAPMQAVLPLQPTDAGNDWVSVGPFGGDVTDLAVNPIQPLSVYATAGTPFYSSDGGTNWTPMDALLLKAGGPINAIECAANGVLIATGTYVYGKVFRSTDNGSTWQSRTIPVATAAQCITMDPNDTNTMYVGLVAITGAASNLAIVKSVNGGVNWTAIDMTTVFPDGYGVVSIAVDPDNSQTVFAIAQEGFSNALLAASFDGGATWEDRTNNLPSGIPYNKAAIGGGKVYVAGGQLFGSQYMGVYQSTNYGLTWTNISQSFPNKVSNTIVVDPSDPDRLFVGTEGDGIYTSGDGGSTWNYTTVGAGEGGAARTILFSPGSTDTVFAGYLSIGICRSIDAGAGWDYSSNGMATLLVNDVEIDANDPKVVLASFEAQNSGGCYLSNDTGHTWSLVTGLPGTRFTKVGVFADGALCAWSNGPSTVAQEGLYKSTDHGVTWTNMGPNVGTLFETEIAALATSATDPDLVFIGGNNFGVNGWKPVIHRSRNGGGSWENVFIGTEDFDSFTYLFIDPNSSDEVIYAGMKSETAGALLKSTNGGDTWEVISGGIPGPEKWFGAVICSPDDSQNVMAGTGGYGTTGSLWLSADGGNTWSPSDLSLGTYSKVQDLCVNPGYTDVIYAATSDDGAWLSADGGQHWEVTGDGLPASNITGFSGPWNNGSGWNIFASTYTNSIYRTLMYDPTLGVNDPGAGSRLTVTPNPCDGNFRIHAGPVSGQVTRVRIFDATGRMVAEINNPERSGDLIPVHVDLAPGVYVGRITGKQHQGTFQVMVIE